MNSWITVAPGIHQRRYQPLDVSVVAIVGETGVLVVDTRNNPAEARELRADVERAFGRRVIGVVNTHAHYDHSFGNQEFDGIPIYGHYLVPAHYERYEKPRLLAQQADPRREPDKSWAEVRLTPPNELIEHRTTIMLDGRSIELLPQAPGHTDTDLVVLVPDARTWIVGDLIEESGPPMYGSGSFPFGWPGVLDGLDERMSHGDRIVPGHGAVVDRAFLRHQRDELAAVATAIGEAHATGLTIDESIAATLERLPWPVPVVRSAFERGFEQLDAEGV